MVSLADYLLRMQPEQEEIYFINGPSRAAIEAGPYVEMFKQKEIEIIYTQEPIDDFVLNHLGEFDGKKLVSADSADLSLLKEEQGDESKKEEGEAEEGDFAGLLKWMQELLKDSIAEVSLSKRLVDSPAMVVNPDSYMTSSMERVMAASRKEHGIGGMESSKKKMEINPKNPLIEKLAELHGEEEEFAQQIAWQIHDNAMIQAGLPMDPLKMVDRNYKLLQRAVGR